MGQKKINQVWAIQNGAMTGTTTLLSSGLYVGNLDSIGIEVTWTGTPTGTLSIAGSVSAIDQFLVNNVPKIVPAVNYYALTFVPALTQPSGSAGGYLIDLQQYPFPYLQIQYANSTGTGVLNAYLFGKDLN